jgi:hypothetical protein
MAEDQLPLQRILGISLESVCTARSAATYAEVFMSALRGGPPSFAEGSRRPCVHRSATPKLAAAPLLAGGVRAWGDDIHAVTPLDLSCIRATGIGLSE